MSNNIEEPVQAEIACKGCTLKINDAYEFESKTKEIVHVPASIKVQGLKGATYAQQLPADLIDTLYALRTDPDFNRILAAIREREQKPQALRQ